MSHLISFQSSSYFLLLLSLFLGPPAATGEETKLHLRPDASSPVVGVHEEIEELNPLSGGTFLSDEAAAQGWKVVELPGRFDGYVESRNVLKDLTVPEGTPIYLEPRSDPGMFLTIVGDVEEAEVLGTAGDWTEVTLISKIPAYFHDIPPSILPDPEETYQPAPVQPDWTTQEVSPVEQRDLEEAPPRTRQETRTVSRAGENPPGAGELRLFEGRLEKTRRFLWFGPSHPYQLVDQRGNRIALLDTRNLLVTASLERYVDSTCVVFGRISKPDGAKDVVILVENIRLKGR